MKRLFSILVIFYCIGIILVNLVWVNFWAISGCAVIVLGMARVILRKNYVFFVLTCILAFLLGALNMKNSYILPKCHISHFVYYKNDAICNLTGFIDSDPEIKGEQTSFVFSAKEIQVDNLKWACCGKVLVRMDFLQDLNYADSLILRGVLRRSSGFSSRSCSYQDYLSRQGILLRMRIKNSLQIIPQFNKDGSKIVIFSLWLRIKMEQVINRYLTDLPAGILSAMVLGQRKAIPWLVNNSMIKSGTVHILVVSGFNVGIVAFIINLLLKIIRIKRKGRIILVAISLLIYCFVTGATNPVVRATVMGLVFLLAHLLKRDPDIYNSLASAALFILVINPRQLLDVGFQLSFSSVFAIIYLYPKLKQLLHIDNYKIIILRFVFEGFLVSFCAWIGTICIIAYNFRIIAPVTVLANIFIVPLATLITLCGFTLVLCGLLCPFLAGFVSTTTAMLIILLLNINAAVIKIPGAYFYF